MDYARVNLDTCGDPTITSKDITTNGTPCSDYLIYAFPLNKVATTTQTTLNWGSSTYNSGTACLIFSDPTEPNVFVRWSLEVQATRDPIRIGLGRREIGTTDMFELVAGNSYLPVTDFMQNVSNSLYLKLDKTSEYTLIASPLSLDYDFDFKYVTLEVRL